MDEFKMIDGRLHILGERGKETERWDKVADMDVLWMAETIAADNATAFLIRMRATQKMRTQEALKKLL